MYFFTTDKAVGGKVMKAKKKKDPNDYPLLAVRMPEDVKTRLWPKLKKLRPYLISH